MAIMSFADPDAEALFVAGRAGTKVGWRAAMKVVKRKLDMLNYAARLADLRAPPGDRLEALRGELRGLHSIRINDRWRVVFRWTPAGPSEVRVCDYH